MGNNEAPKRVRCATSSLLAIGDTRRSGVQVLSVAVRCCVKLPVAGCRLPVGRRKGIKEKRHDG